MYQVVYNLVNCIIGRHHKMDDRVLEVTPGVRAEGAIALSRYLLEEIQSGRMGAGFKLPAERELSERFGASRGAVRRVLNDLRERGLITQVAGSGTFVSESVQPSISIQPAESDGIGAISPAELMDARLVIEPAMPSLIVQYGTATDFDRMDECLERSEAARTVEEFEYWDGALHEAFANATHNTFMLKVMDLATKVREQGEWGRLKQRSLTPERRLEYEAQHRQIVSALRDRDEATARQVIEQHLLQIRKNLFGR